MKFFKGSGKDKPKEGVQEDAKAEPPKDDKAKKDPKAKKKDKEAKSDKKKNKASKSAAGKGAPAATSETPSGPPPSEGPKEMDEKYVNPDLANATTYEEKSEACEFAELGFIPTVKKVEADNHHEFPRFVLSECKNNGAYQFRTKGNEKHQKGKSILKGMQEFKKNPAKWISMSFQANSTGWPTREQEYFMIERKGSIQLHPKDASDTGWQKVLMLEYQHLPVFPNNELPLEFRDKYTDEMRHEGVKIHSDKFKPIMPGRGMGCADTPIIKVIGDIDPSDIKQGQVGCCWLLSAISALAEFDGAIKKLFRKTPDLHLMPKATPNMYTITLWDLPTWTEVDIVVDERLAANPNTKFTCPDLLSAKPSDDGELWVCYLEKAVAIHCGGWDAITGGQCTHAWSILTGCKEQYIILRNSKTGKWACYARYNPHTKQWLPHFNDIHKCDNVTGVWPVPFPQAGACENTGDANHEMTDEELFVKMFHFDEMNYIVSAGSKGGGTDAGLVDNHAYTVIEARQNVAGTGIDMYKVRNPWGKGEIKCGEFDDDGPGWVQYPQIKAELNPVVANDGIFWVTKKEFFEMFKSIYVSASNMTKFLED